MQHDDDFLNDLRETPPPAFAASLYRRLEASDRARETRREWMPRLRPALAGGLALACVIALAGIPSVRARGQQFLDLFRVQHFVAVPLDADRVAALRANKAGIESLLGDRVERLTPDTEPRAVASATEAADATGMPVLVPTYVFNADADPAIRVVAPRAARVTADAARLRELLSTLGVDDVTVPDALDGAKITVSVPAAVSMRYSRDGAWVATLTEARSPRVDVPDGVRLADLGEIGLRLSGMSAAEARDFSNKIDWSSTLLVPVPTAAASYQQVEVRGTTGLLVTFDRKAAADRGPDDAPRSILVWSEDGIVFALASELHSVDALEMANSLAHA